MIETMIDTASATLRLATPLVFAALGGVVVERSGVTNIALEAKLLLGAFAAAVVCHYTGSAWLGLAAGAGSGVLVALCLAFAALVCKADQIVAGVALNVLAFGLPPFAAKLLFDMTGNTPTLPPESLFTWFPTALAIFSAFAIHIWFQHFRSGVELRMTGELPEALRAAGVNPLWVRTKALVLCGLLAGAGGASLSIMLASAYSRNMSAGRGFIALAAMILGGWRPLPTLAACLFLGFFDAVQIRLQDQDIFGIRLDPSIIQLLPYIATIVVVAGFIGKSRAPKALAQPT